MIRRGGVPPGAAAVIIPGERWVIPVQVRDPVLPFQKLGKVLSCNQCHPACDRMIYPITKER